MTDHTIKARDLMAAIRAQVFVPEGTTMGACAKGCGRSARGSGTCAECLARELDALIPPGGMWPDGVPGRMYLHACNMQRAAERDVLAALAAQHEVWKIPTPHEVPDGGR